MKVFNEEKTQILESYDLEKGYLQPDRFLVAHHESVKPQIGEWHYETVAEYPNGGKDVQKVWDKEPVEAQEAWDEYEQIQVYIPYTEEQLLDIKRRTRAPLLNAFDIWEKAVLRGREADSATIMTWYEALLDLQDTALEEIPDKIKYYL